MSVVGRRKGLTEKCACQYFEKQLHSQTLPWFLALSVMVSDSHRFRWKYFVIILILHLSFCTSIGGSGLHSSSKELSTFSLSLSIKRIKLQIHTLDIHSPYLAIIRDDVFHLHCNSLSVSLLPFDQQSLTFTMAGRVNVRLISQIQLLIPTRQSIRFATHTKKHLETQPLDADLHYQLMVSDTLSYLYKFIVLIIIMFHFASIL